MITASKSINGSAVHVTSQAFLHLNNSLNENISLRIDSFAHKTYSGFPQQEHKLMGSPDPHTSSQKVQMLKPTIITYAKQSPTKAQGIDMVCREYSNYI